MRKITYILLLLMSSTVLWAREYGDSAIYQGTFIKLDLLTSAIEAGRSKGKLQSYEMAVSVRLKNRFYPTLEGGYAFGKTGAAGGDYNGHGGFGRIGLDINGLRKRATSPHALLVGIRVGTAYQAFDLNQVTINSPYWEQDRTIDLKDNHRCDVWGEVVAGCNVNVVSGFYMGWAIRIKILFTRKNKSGEAIPYYIPGFGYRDDNNWGVNYYIGWRI